MPLAVSRGFKATSAKRRSLFALNALNFFMADVQGGLGPFLGVFLQARHWTPAEIGVVMTVGGIAGMAVTTPIGALVDRTSWKRAMVVVSALVITAASIATLAWPDMIVVNAAQVATGIAGAAAGAAIAAITLGLVRQRGFAHQLGRNQAYNHSGNVVAAALAGLTGYFFGLGAVFAVLSIMAVFSVAAAIAIDPRQIDHRAARGAAEHDGEGVAGFTVLLQSGPLLVLGATLTLFHLGNAAMLPLLGQAVVAHGGGNPSAFTGATIVVAQVDYDPGRAARRAARRDARLLARLFGRARRIAGARRYRVAGERAMGIGTGANPRWRRRRSLGRCGARPRGAHPVRDRTRQCRTRSGDDAARRRRGAEPDRWRHRRRTLRLSRGLFGARRHCGRRAGALARGAAGDGRALRQPVASEEKRAA